jgi:hypothetical protein
VIPVTLSFLSFAQELKKYNAKQSLQSSEERTMSEADRRERRKRPRLKLSVPLMLIPDSSETPLRGATSDLSATGCYVETIFPLPVGTNLDLQLSLGTTILIAGAVVACDPQVGNGIRFVKMLPEDRETLESFMKAAEEQQEAQRAKEQDAGSTDTDKVESGKK